MGYLIALSAVLAGVLVAFGGREPFSLSLVQIAVFATTGVALWRGKFNNLVQDPSLKWATLLVGYVVFQWAIITGGSILGRDALLLLVSYVCVFYLATLVAQESKLRNRLLVVLLGLGLLEALYGLVQYLAHWPYVLTQENLFYRDRATGTFINPNHFAGFLEMVLPLGLGLTLYRFDKLKNAGRGWLSDSEGHIPRIVSYSLLSTLVFLGILLSRSRMGMVSAVAAVLAMLVLWSTASWRRSRAIPLLLIFVLAAAALGLWIGMEPVVERYATLEQDYLSRRAVWTDTVSLIKANPILGTGLGTYAVRFTEHQTTHVTRLVDFAHNDYLQFTAELGLAGAAIVFGLILAVLTGTIVAFYRAERSRERFMLLACCGSLLALLFHSLADFNLQIPANAFTFITIMALGYTLSRRVADH